jgi:hypothetical protein
MRVPERPIPLEERPPLDPRANALPDSVETTSARVQAAAKVWGVLIFT